MGSTPWLTRREERAWRALQFMQLRVEGELTRQLHAESALSYPDYLVLVALTDRPDGRLRLFELASVLGWEKSRVSHQVTRMADRALVVKKRCDTDRRGAFVVITNKGRREIEAAAPGHVAAVRRVFVDRLTPQQLDAVADAAQAVLAGFDEVQPSATEPVTRDGAGSPMSLR
ncbi:MAG TPA: MarR family transcriptional regulator [Ilumatobacteraceae bacterium]